MKEAHRSRAHKLQRFDHPHPGLSGRTRGSQSDLEARNRNAYFDPLTGIISSSNYARKVPNGNGEMHHYDDRSAVAHSDA
jgi:hypothetical protein